MCLHNHSINLAIDDLHVADQKIENQDHPYLNCKDTACTYQYNDWRQTTAYGQLQNLSQALLQSSYNITQNVQILIFIFITTERSLS